VSGKAVAAELGAAAAVAVGPAAVAGKKAPKDDDTDDTPGMDVAVPLEATPTETAPVATERLGRGDATYGGGAPSRKWSLIVRPASPIRQTTPSGQPTDPDRI
jgi:hypothetical protein